MRLAESGRLYHQSRHHGCCMIVNCAQCPIAIPGWLGMPVKQWGAETPTRKLCIHPKRVRARHSLPGSTVHMTRSLRDYPNTMHGRQSSMQSITSAANGQAWGVSTSISHRLPTPLNLRAFSTSAPNRSATLHKAQGHAYAGSHSAWHSSTCWRFKSHVARLSESTNPWIQNRPTLGSKGGAHAAASWAPPTPCSTPQAVNTPSHCSSAPHAALLASLPYFPSPSAAATSRQKTETSRVCEHDAVFVLEAHSCRLSSYPTQLTSPMRM